MVMERLARNQELVPSQLPNSHSSRPPGYITTNPQDIHHQYINSNRTRPLLSTRGGLADPLPGTGALEYLDVLRTCRLAVVFTGVEMAATHVICRPNSTKAVAYHAACQQIHG